MCLLLPTKRQASVEFQNTRPYTEHFSLHLPPLLGCSVKLRSTSTMWVAFVATVLMAPRISTGDEADTPEVERDKKVQLLIDATVERYRLLPAFDAQTPLDPQVAIRWRNPTRGGQANAILVLWVHHGRPAAAASVFAQGELCHEFVSLSRTAGLVAHEGDEVVWSSSVAGVRFQEVADAPAPADSPVVRLRQMKELVRRFSASFDGVEVQRVAARRIAASCRNSSTATT